MDGRASGNRHVPLSAIVVPLAALPKPCQLEYRADARRGAMVTTGSNRGQGFPQPFVTMRLRRWVNHVRTGDVVTWGRPLLLHWCFCVASSGGVGVGNDCPGGQRGGAGVGAQFPTRRLCVSGGWRVAGLCRRASARFPLCGRPAGSYQPSNSLQCPVSADDVVRRGLQPVVGESRHRPRVSTLLVVDCVRGVASGTVLPPPPPHTHCTTPMPYFV